MHLEVLPLELRRVYFDPMAEDGRVMQSIDVVLNGLHSITYPFYFYSLIQMHRLG